MNKITVWTTTEMGKEVHYVQISILDGLMITNMIKKESREDAKTFAIRLSQMLHLKVEDEI